MSDVHSGISEPPPIPRPERQQQMQPIASAEERLSRLELRLIQLLHRVAALEGQHSAADVTHGVAD